MAVTSVICRDTKQQTLTSRCRKTQAVPRVMNMQVADRRLSRPLAKAAFMPSRQAALSPCSKQKTRHRFFRDLRSWVTVRAGRWSAWRMLFFLIPVIFRFPYIGHIPISKNMFYCRTRRERKRRGKRKRRWVGTSWRAYIFTHHMNNEFVYARYIHTHTHTGDRQTGSSYDLWYTTCRENVHAI